MTMTIITFKESGLGSSACYDMSIPVTNVPMPGQNIVLGQVQVPHSIMTNVNANNGIPMGAGLPHPVDNSEMKSPMVMESMPPVQNQVHTVQQSQTHVKSLPSTASGLDQAQILTKQRLQDIIRETDSTLTLEDEVEEIILSYVDEFVDRCLKGAALIAKNRHVNTIEVKDVQQFLNRNYSMWTPGFGTDELRPYKRSLTTEAHKQRLTLIRKTQKKF